MLEVPSGKIQLALIVVMLLLVWLWAAINPSSRESL